jgi:hypothetical protein
MIAFGIGYKIKTEYADLNARLDRIDMNTFSLRRMIDAYPLSIINLRNRVEMMANCHSKKALLTWTFGINPDISLFLSENINNWKIVRRYFITFTDDTAALFYKMKFC